MTAPEGAAVLIGALVTAAAVAALARRYLTARALAPRR